VQPHAGSKSIKYPYYARIDGVVAMVRHRHRLGEALRLVVHTTHADAIDAAPVILALRVLLRIAVDLAGAGQQVAGLLQLRQAQTVRGVFILFATARPPTGFLPGNLGKPRLKIYLRTLCYAVRPAFLGQEWYKNCYAADRRGCHGEPLSAHVHGPAPSAPAPP